MEIVRHPELANDIRKVAEHYADVSERVLERFWSELDASLVSIEKNPTFHHFDSSGLRRAPFRRFPYHVLYDLEDDRLLLLLLVLRHDRRHPEFGLDRLS